MADERPSRVAFLLLPGFAMIAYASAIESLRAANQIAGTALYSWHNVSPDGGPVVASNGLEFGCEFDTAMQRAFDFVFVCASDAAVHFNEPRTLGWLRHQAAQKATLGGMSGGAFVLARAGLLHGRRATLHWFYASSFSEEFPDVDLRRSLYEIDGDRMTCGGGTAPMDMMHSLLRREHGDTIAVGVSEWFLHTAIREGQKPQRLSLELRLGIHHEGLVRALEAMETSLEEPLPRSALAAISGVSERQLERLFLSCIGTPIGAYYLRLRLERARELVIQSSLPLLEVGIVCGFDRASTFSKSYRRLFGIPPRLDRARAMQRMRVQD